MIGNLSVNLEKILKGIEVSNPPTLLLHSCCAPCSTYVLEYLAGYFKITVLYYNPNIFPDTEYRRRADEQKKLIDALNPTLSNVVAFVEGKFDSGRFYQAVSGFEDAVEGGERCAICYELRLREAALYAKDGGFDYFTTTLSISPHKNAQKLYEIGESIAGELKIKQLPADFKKKGGFKRSIELSKTYELYRQDYCGCQFSMV